MAKRTINLDTKDIEIIIEGLQLLSKPSTQVTNILRKMKNNMKTIKVSSRKSKGRGLEQWVCKEISNILNLPFNPGDDNSPVDYRRMGQAGVDIILRGMAQKLFPYCIETKATESLNLTDTVKQAENNTVEPYDWLIVHKRKILKEPVVILSWSSFKKLHSN